MSTLKMNEKVIFEKLFNRGGYVLDFSDSTFSEFFRENNIDIDQEKYLFNGPSKMKRLRAFWEIEPDNMVGRVLESLLKYAYTVGDIEVSDKEKAETIIARLKGEKSAKSNNKSQEKEFLEQEFKNLNLEKLNIDHGLLDVIEKRIEEIQKSLESKAALATIFLCGSTLEGLLLSAASINAIKFNQSKSSPKLVTGKVKRLQDWTLENFINVAYEVGVISLDIKKYSHSIKDFRNYIHPREQVLQNFQPDQHTAKISWQVLQAAIADLIGER